MNLDLPENLDAFVKAQVQSGRFASEQDVMAEAVRTLKSRLDQAETVEAVRQGIADVDAGRTISLEEFREEMTEAVRPLRQREEAREARTLEGIRRGLEDMKAGRGRPAEEVFAEIRREFNILPDA